jgi:3-methyladenine DNA glycosylase AlkD
MGSTDKAFGVRMAGMQKMTEHLRGADTAQNHELAAALWETGWYEARIVAAFVDEPVRVTPM